MDLQSTFSLKAYSQDPVLVLQISMHERQPANHRTFPLKKNMAVSAVLMVQDFLPDGDSILTITLHCSFCRSGGRFLESLESNAFSIRRPSSFSYRNHYKSIRKENCLSTEVYCKLFCCYLNHFSCRKFHHKLLIQPLKPIVVSNWKLSYHGLIQ